MAQVVTVLQESAVKMVDLYSTFLVETQLVLRSLRLVDVGLWFAASLITVYFMFMQPKRSRVSTAKITDRNDPYWLVAHTDEHEKIERAVPTELGSGRVVRADVVRIYPDSFEEAHSSPKRVFLFIPGNPGLVDFYLVLLRQIFEKLGKDCYVCAIGHAGHSSQSHSKSSDHISYQEQIEHKVKFVLQEFPWLAHNTSGSELIISGHSVGARIGLEVMHQLHGTVKFERYFGLCPTVLHIGQSPNGKKLGPLLGSPFARSAAVSLVRFLSILLAVLPHSAGHYLAKSVMKKDCPEVNDYYVQHGLKLVDPFIIRNVMMMANDEVKEILGKEDQSIQHALEKEIARITFVLSPCDKWCHDGIVEMMRDTFVGSKFIMLNENVNHAFCLSHGQVLDVANAIIETLQSD